MCKTSVMSKVSFLILYRNEGKELRDTCYDDLSTEFPN